MSAHRIARSVMTALLVFVGAHQAAAQSGNAGPMTIERIHNGALFAADTRLTEIDGRSAALVGGEVDWVVDDSIGIGGAGYWLANGSRNRRMAYGGLTLRWLARTDSRFGYGFKALIGGGEATLGETLTEFVPVRNAVTGRITGESRSVTVPFRRQFFIAEPEANVSLRVVSHLRVTGGVGYRLIGSESRNDDRLRGVTGTVGLQLF